MVSEGQLHECKARLKARFSELREEIRMELLESDDQHYIDLAGQVHDLEEESVADLLVDIDLAIIDMHIAEIREIDQSLMRLAEGSYGICLDCRDEINFARLSANLTAKRCTDCQKAYEHSHAGPGQHSL